METTVIRSATTEQTGETRRVTVVGCRRNILSRFSINYVIFPRATVVVVHYRR